MNKCEEIAKEIEIEFIQFTNKSEQEKLNSLPITETDRIVSLIWNLTHSVKWKTKISYNDFQSIVDIWINRINQSEIQSLRTKLSDLHTWITENTVNVTGQDGVQWNCIERDELLQYLKEIT